MAASCCEKRPAGFFAVPLNIRCSRKCAMPDLPGGSSAAPTRYHSMWVTTGVRRSGITTTVMPLARVNCVTAVAAAASRRCRRGQQRAQGKDQEGANQHGRHGLLSWPRCLAQGDNDVAAAITINCRSFPTGPVRMFGIFQPRAGVAHRAVRLVAPTASGSRAAAGSAGRASARLRTWPFRWRSCRSAHAS